MKILVVSNVYPPYFIGGYELGCRSMVQALTELGNDIRVLTSTYGIGKECVEGNIHRLLQIDSNRLPLLVHVLRKEIINQRHFRRQCEEFKPDLVFCWNLANISLSVACIAGDLRIPVSYYVFDNWLATCEMDQWFQHCMSLTARHKFLLNSLLGSLRFLLPGETQQLANAIFASRYLKHVACLAGKDTADSKVLHWGVSSVDSVDLTNKKASSIIYLGQIVPLKGVHTVVEAIGILRRDYGIGAVTLTVVGDVEFNPEYIRHLQGLIARYDIADCVHFTGKVAYEVIGKYLRSHDVLVFSSIWDEPFGISQLEAMACGLAVVGTATGGSAEILRHEANALVFERDNPLACAKQLRRLVEDEKLFNRLRSAAVTTVREHFDFADVVCSMDRLLKENASVRKLPFGRPLPVDKLVPKACPKNFYRETVLLAHKLISVLLLVTFRVRNLAIRWLTGAGRRLVQASRKQQEDATLFVALGDASDLVLATSFLSSYREAFSERKIGVVARSELTHLLRDLPDIDFLVDFPLTAVGNWQKMARGHVKWWCHAGKLRDRLPASVRTVISFGWRRDSVTAASAAVIHRLAAPEAIGFRDSSNGLASRILDHFAENGPFRRALWNGMAALQELGGCLGVPAWLPGSSTIRHTDTGESRSELNNFLEGAFGPVIALAPGADDDLCCWPLERYLELGNWLQSQYAASLLIVGSARDRQRCGDLYDGLTVERKFLWVGDMPLQELYGAMPAISLLCGNDNYFFYAAVLAGRPAVGLFGPSADDRIDMLPGRQEVVRLTVTCSPCACDCLYNEPICLHGIELARVKKSVKAKLEA